MNIILIAPVSSGSSGVNRITTASPLGLAYLAAVVQEMGHSCRIIDADVTALPAELVAKEVARRRPDLIGISSHILNWRGVPPLVELFKRQFPHLPVILGGPFPSAIPEHCLKRSRADAVVVGEGEITLRELCAVLEKGIARFENIDGLVWRDSGGQVRRNAPRALIADIDELPFPAWERLESMPLYHGRARRLPVAAITTSRGCPCRCSFCSRSVFGNRYRAHSPARVLEEIRRLMSDFGVRQIDVVDDNFTLNRVRAVEILERIAALPTRLSVNLLSGIRADHLTPELPRLMKRAGVYSTTIGIESGDQEILDAAGKGSRLEKVSQAVRVLRKEGILVVGAFIIGLPGDCPETMERTIRFAIRCNPHLTKFAIATPCPGTALYSQIEREGRFLVPTQDGIETGYFGNRAFFEIGVTRAEDVEYFYRRAFRRFYFRPRKIIDLVSTIRSPSEIKWVWQSAKAIGATLFSRRKPNP